LVFAILAVLTQLLAYQRYLIFKDGKDQEVIQEANLRKEQLIASLSYSLTATKTLAFIVDRFGVPENFDSVAALILESNKFIDALELTRRGVITHVSPLKGNEPALGYDIFNDSTRNEEAYKALERKRLHFAGPLRLKQGGTGVVGRLPIFHNGEFFGFSVAIIRLETFIAAAGMDKNNHQFRYQLSKINPDTGKEEFFIPGPSPDEHGYSFAVEIPDGDWKLYIIPAENFYEIHSGVFISILGLLFSATAGLFAWYLAQQPEKLNRLVQEKAEEVFHLKRNAVTTIERVSDAFISLDRNWRYTYMNKKAGEIFQRDPQSMIGKHIWTEFPEGVGQPFYHAYHRAMKEQRHIHLEEYYAPFDQWFENHIYPSRDGLSIYFRNVTEAKKAAQRIESSEKYYRTLIEKSSDAIVLLDREHKIIYHSPSTERITGYSFEELHSKPSIEFINPAQKQYFQKTFESIIEKPAKSVKATFQVRHKKGYQIWIEGTYTNLLQDQYIEAVVFNYRDITERVEAEEKIKSVNRFYLFTSRINQMMIHARDEKTVYEEVCTIAIDVGKFRMAWIGKIDTQKKLIVPVSFAGYDEGYISGGKVFSLDDPDVQKGPTATAIRNGVYFYSNDIGNDPRMTPWAKDALEREFRAAIALPIKKRDQVVGVFHIYSQEKYCFDDNEITLLEEATRNIAFTLENLENEHLRQEAEKQIENEKLLSDSIINSLPGVFYLLDRNGKFIRWNKNFELVTGMTSEEMKHLHPLDFFEGDDRTKVQQKIGEVFTSGHSEVTAYFTTKDKKRIPYYYNGTRVYFEGIEYLIGTGIDITPRVNAENELRARTEEIQKLTGYLQHIREEERTHIAREIHDVIGQQLTAMKMDASWIRKKVPADEPVAERLTGMIALIDETIKTVRRISSELRPVMLDDFGLVSALEWQTSEFRKNSGIDAKFVSDFEEEELDKDLATNIFRVYQEALTNIARHSGASQVESVLDFRDDLLELKISDNGVGFDENEVKKKKSLGLLGMKERARMFEGQLVFVPNHPTGTRLILSIPIKKKINASV
jgi:PAS domain S-box-containing protein